MIKYYRTMDHQIHEISEPMEGTWISLIHPTAAELAKIATDYKIDIDDLRAPLDEEERSHIEVPLSKRHGCRSFQGHHRIQSFFRPATSYRIRY